MPAVNYMYDEEDHRRWRIAVAHKGITMKEWVRLALNKVAAEEEAERAEADRKRRSR